MLNAKTSRMKRLNSLAVCLATLALCFGFASCADSDEFPDMQIYQQYEVLITPTSKAAFANLREGSASGQMLYFSGEALTVNTKMMYYNENVPSDGFNYSAYLDENHKKAIFSFNRKNNVTLVNEVEFGSIPEVEIPQDFVSVVPFGKYTFNLNGLSPENLEIWLGESSRRYDAVVNAFTGEFSFAEVPVGTYDLNIDYVKVTPTTQNDGTAGGSIRLVRRQIRRAVTVEAVSE